MKTRNQIVISGLILSSLMSLGTGAETEEAGLKGAHLRVARPTDDLAPVVEFYRDGLGFEKLGSFEDHDGFDGVMLGHPEMGYHLEFTHQRGHDVGKAPTEDHLLVFYFGDEEVWKAAVERMQRHGYEPVEPWNPYWKTRGETFEDPDGYRVVLANFAWR